VTATERTEGSPRGIVIRALIPDDLPEMLRLHTTRDDVDAEGARQRTELLEWLAFHNPFARPDETTYYVAESDGKIVAYHGRMPVQFGIRGKIEHGHFVHDLYVDPEFRKKGLGLQLTFDIALAIEQGSKGFFCLCGMTNLNKLIQTKCGYVELTADSFLRRISIYREARKVLRLGAAALIADAARGAWLSVYDRFVSARTGVRRISVVRVPRFDDEADALHDRISPKLGVCSSRTSAHLNWKYVDRPYRRERIVAARRNGILSGYAVVGLSPYKRDYPVGLILDLIADPDDTTTISALVLASMRELKSMKALAVRCIMTDSRFSRILERCAFSRETVGQSMMLGNLEKSDAKDFLMDIRSWHMTRSESDAFMLSP